MSLKTKDLTVEYSSGGYRLRAISDLNMEVNPGELALLLGPSGSGKTTLLSILSGILSPTSGWAAYGDIDISSLKGKGLTHYRRHVVGTVFQAFNLIPSLSAVENVEMPLLAAGRNRREARERAMELIERVDLIKASRQKPGELSGGQQQRVAIARALAFDPPLLLADEPTAHLDYLQVESIIVLLRELATSGRTVVVATHDERLLPIADRVIELAAKVAAHGEMSTTVDLATGDILFRQGDASDLVYVVDKGAIDIIKERADGTEELLATLERGQHFGDLGPLLGLRRSATARAHATTTVTGYTVPAFRNAVGNGLSGSAPPAAGTRKRTPSTKTGEPARAQP